MTTQVQENQEQNVTLTDYLRILYRGRWLILFSFIIVFTATVYYTFTSDLIYEASTTIIIDENASMQNAIFDFNTFGSQNTHISNQIEILRSRSLSERVIKRVELSDIRDSLSLFQPNEEGEYKTLRQMVSIIHGSMDVVNKKETDII